MSYRGDRAERRRIRERIRELREARTERKQQFVGWGLGAGLAVLVAVLQHFGCGLPAL